MSQAHHALKSHKFVCSQGRYDEYEIQSISLFQGLHGLTSTELSFYNIFNAILPTMQEKADLLIKNEEKLKQLIKDYSLLLTAWKHDDENELNLMTNIPVSLEILLIWRTHLLNTSHYHKDCMNSFGSVINYKYNNINHSNSALHIDSNEFQNALRPVIAIDVNDLNVISIDFAVFQNALLDYCRFISHCNLRSIDSSKTMTRYRYFMYLKYITNENKINNSNLHLIASADILLLWHCHIIYNISSYFDFSFQLFANTILKYDFVLSDDTVTNNDIQQTQRLWDTYFGANSYRDYAFNNFVFGDEIFNANEANTDIAIGGGARVGEREYIFDGNLAPEGFNNNNNNNNNVGNSGKKSFFYHRENRKCALCLGVIGYEVIVLVICLILYFTETSLVFTLMVLFGATLLMALFVCFTANRNLCSTDDEEIEDAKIEVAIKQYPKEYRN